MQIELIDWIVIISYLVMTIIIGIWCSKKASANTDEFFIAGRSLSWWVAGTSIVATTFAADSPLAVSAFSRQKGLAENWFWWSGVMGGILCVFFYAKLWRRAGIVTDVEFINIRYSGKSAGILRFFLALFNGIAVNCIVMGWVTLAMGKICAEVFGLPELFHINFADNEYLISSKFVVLSILVITVLIYTVLSGLWGVVVTDFVQFIVAMAGSISLAAIVLYKTGGPAQMTEKVLALPEVSKNLLSFIPDFHEAGKLAFFTFIVYLSVQWWASGQGAGYVAQRLFATKNEKHAVMASLWANFAHFAIRPWPWIIVGIASLLYIPITNGEDPELAYPKMMIMFLPAGLRGLLIVSFLAAFMSTIDTHLNWGASYLVNDFYKVHFPKQSEKAYVRASRLSMVFLMILVAITSLHMDSVIGAWKYLAQLGAGGTFVALLRWYWWRINVWSEISALISSIVISNILLFIDAVNSPDFFAVRLVIIIALSTVCWITVTFLTSPENPEHLDKFYRRVRPGGWWNPIAVRNTDIQTERLCFNWIGWLAGSVCVYTSIFGLGYILIGQTCKGITLLVVSIICGWKTVSFAGSMK